MKTTLFINERIRGFCRKLLFFFFTISFGYAGVIYADTAVVNCNGNANARADIQAAIDNAASGDTIKLVGTCVLDGTEINITKSDITIDGAGAAGGWSSVLLGQSLNGIPRNDKPASQGRLLFNRGFKVGPVPSNGSISNVVIRNIKFQDLNIGIEISPSIIRNTTLCSDTVVSTNINATDFVVSDNWFDNNFHAIEGIGKLNNATVSNNLITKNRLSAMFFEGNAAGAGCVGGAGFVNIDTPTNVTITENTITNGLRAQDIGIFGVEKGTVSKNYTQNANGSVSIYLSSNNEVTVSNNEVDGSNVTSGIISWDTLFGLSPPSNKVLIVNNTILNSYPGVLIANDTTGSSVVNNQFSGSVGADIYLCGANSSFYCPGGNASFKNKVITTSFGDVVTDLGTNNQLLGTQNLINNPNVPTDVSSKLISSSIGRPDLDPDQ